MNKINIFMGVILLSLVIFLLGCSPKTPPITISTPQTTESVIPKFEDVRSGINESVNSNLKLDGKIREHKKVVIEQTNNIKEAIKISEVIKDRSLKNELIEFSLPDRLGFVLSNVESHNRILDNQIDEMNIIIQEQGVVLITTKDDVDNAYKKLIDKENETLQLRNQNLSLIQDLNTINKDAENLKKQLSKEKVKSAKASVYRNWVIGIISGFVIWTLIKNIIMVYFPVKFRV